MVLVLVLGRRKKRENRLVFSLSEKRRIGVGKGSAPV